MARSRRETRRARQQREKRRGLMLLALVLLIGIGLGAAYFWERDSRVALNPQTYCPTAGPRSATVVLIDRTDPLDTVQRSAIKLRLEELRQAIPKY